MNSDFSLNIGILLAGGISSRFNLSLSENKISKQLYLLDGKPLINYSIDAFLELENNNLNYRKRNKDYYYSISK